MDNSCSSTTLTIVEDTAINMNVLDVGIQGLSGVEGKQGKALTYDDLTDEQKLELQVGIIETTNYTNIFLNTLIGE